jgi:hypothetical protein
LQQAPTRSGIAIAVCILLLLLIANHRRLRRIIARARFTRHPERAPQSAATLWYERLVRTLARHGWRKTASQTPQEFLAAIDDPALRNSVADFTASYERARFAASAADAQRLPELYDKIGVR